MKIYDDEMDDNKMQVRFLQCKSNADYQTKFDILAHSHLLPFDIRRFIRQIFETRVLCRSHV